MLPSICDSASQLLRICKNLEDRSLAVRGRKPPRYSAVAAYHYQMPFTHNALVVRSNRKPLKINLSRYLKIPGLYICQLILLLRRIFGVASSTLPPALKDRRLILKALFRNRTCEFSFNLHLSSFNAYQPASYKIAGKF